MIMINENKDKRKQQMIKYYNDNKEKLSSYKQTYYEKNKEIIKQKTKKYKEEHKEKYKLLGREYWKKNKAILGPINSANNKLRWANRTPEEKEQYKIKKNTYEKKKKKIDLNYALKKRLRIRVWQAFNGIRKKSSDELGIDYNLIIKHLNDSLPSDYNINPSKYEIDHIIPLSSFDFSDEEQVKKAFVPENHQWLTASDNASKKDLTTEEWKMKKSKPKDLNTSEDII